jgi:PAS domain S-box-containing protein
MVYRSSLPASRTPAWPTVTSTLAMLAIVAASAIGVYEIFQANQPCAIRSIRLLVVLLAVVFLALVILAMERLKKRELLASLMTAKLRLRTAEEAAHCKEAMLGELQRLGQIGIWQWDPKDRTVTWSEELYRIHGLDPKSPPPSYEELPHLLTTESWHQLREAMSRVAGPGLAPHVDLELIRPDGSRRWVSTRIHGVRDSTGEIVSIHGITLDITESKRMLERLRQTEAQLTGIVNFAKDAIIVADEEQRISLFNSAAEMMFDCPAKKAIGSSIDRFLPGFFRQEYNEHTLGSATTMTANQPIVWNTLQGVRPDGEEFQIEASTLRIESGGKEIFAVIIRDISDRLRAEEVRRESEERLRLIANAVPVMIWMSAASKMCNYVNKAWLDFTGRPLEAELGDGWWEVVHPEDLQFALKTYTQVFDRWECFTAQYRVRRHDGEYRWIMNTGVPWFNPDGSFAGYVGSCVDVTVRKLAEEALATTGRRLIEAHEEERTWIARELHDDINQRLALLTVELDRWNQDAPLADEFSQQIRHVQQRIAEIAEDLQRLSHRLHSSKLEYLGLVAAAKSVCKEVSEENKVEVSFTHFGLPRTLPQDISLCFFRVLQEALQNAVKHSGVRNFTVELRGTSKEIELSIADAGRGFEEQEVLGGKGLGLISMRERLQLVHGEFAIRTAPGSGTTIYARVPFEPEERAMAG